MFLVVLAGGIGVGIGAGAREVARFVQRRKRGGNGCDHRRDGGGGDDWPTDDLIDELKNAMLSFALGRLRTDDIDDKVAYSAYDGTKLPPMSGFDVQNACMTYIAKVPSESLIADQKTRAIQRYLRRNLDSPEKVSDFFFSFVEDYEDRFYSSSSDTQSHSRSRSRSNRCSGRL